MKKNSADKSRSFLNEANQAAAQDDQMAEAKPKHFIAGAIKHPGALHKELGVPEGKKIPQSMLAKAAKSSNPTLRRRALLAKTLEAMHH